MVRSRKRSVPILAHRSRVELGTIVGVTDVELPGLVVEVKHAGHTEGHQRQALVYAALANKKARLCNTKEGWVRTLEGDPPVMEAARAILAAKQARSAKVRVRKRISLRPYRDTLVSIDVETDQGGRVLEVGGVAFSRADGAVLGVFHRLAMGVTPATDHGSMGADAGTGDARAVGVEGRKWRGVEALCGFAEMDTDRVSADQERLRADVDAWLGRFPDHDVVQWGGHDSRVLGLGRTPVDALGLFRVWVERQSLRGGYRMAPRRSGLRLGDAVEQMVGPGRMVPHRAFEDAVGTMIVLIAISE